jgi:hypothetical protein
MPSRRSSGTRAQGGGRTPNSEPRLQVFRDFAGLNFEHSGQMNPVVVVDGKMDDNRDQTDLQMNYTFLQNNVSVASNKTLETRDDIVNLFVADEAQFTGPVCLIGPKLYIAQSDESVAVCDLDERAEAGNPTVVTDTLELSNHTYSQHIGRLPATTTTSS